jgi:hypothetical protein
MDDLFDHQQEFLDGVVHQPQPARACLYFRTGAGKSRASLEGMKALGHLYVVVIAPPSTHPQWAVLAESMGMSVLCMSHAKYRMKDTLLSRKVPIIMDEVHLLGGHKGKGWRKFDSMSRHLQAPIFMLSATPNYNDAERCYCIVHVLNPHMHKGGYLAFLYANCQTEQNPFGMEPRVTGFLRYKDAAEFLADQEGVYYLADDLVYTIDDVPYDQALTDELLDYGYNRREHKMVGSLMEMRHTSRLQGLVGEDGCIRPDVFDGPIVDVIYAANPLLVYCNRSTIAQALARSLDKINVRYAMVTGDTPKMLKHAIIQEFLSGEYRVLIGTATLATGTDGMDRVCDNLLILDDTDDDALRRQLVGRIMPRGDFVSPRPKQVIRLLPT